MTVHAENGHAAGDATSELAAVVRFWHDAALAAALTDFSTVDEQDKMAAPEQPVATYQSRAMAIVHIAIYDAYVGITKEGATYSCLGCLPKVEECDVLRAVQSAVMEAAFRTLKDLYPRQECALAALRESYRKQIADLHEEAARFGRLAAAELIKDRSRDGAFERPFNVPFGDGPWEPFEHAPDPTVPEQNLHAPHWGGVRPFGFRDMDLSAPQIPPPLELDYEGDFNEVLSLGRNTDSGRTDDQTDIGVYWAYDGAFKIGTPNRLYNLVIDAFIHKASKDPCLGSKVASGYQLAKLWAVCNTAMADASIRAWHDKYKFNLWRPAVGIPSADTDGIDGTKPDRAWKALASPMTNTRRPPETPNFPSYPSGHATIGTAALRAAEYLMCLPKDFEVTFVSEELDGISTDRDGRPRPRRPRTLTIDKAVTENQDSRLYLGVHWRMDSTQGGVLGEGIGVKLAESFPQKV